MKARRSDTLGFTLIEILMAMAIFTLVMTAIYSTWMAIMRGSRAAMKVATDVQRERIALSTMEQALSAARSFQGDIKHYAFLGENGNEPILSFVAQLPGSFPRSGRWGDFDVRRVVFAVETHDNEKQLVMRQAPILMDFDRDEMEHPLVLLRGVNEMNFQFWDTQLGDWADEWKQTNQIPKMVKITLDMAQTSKNASRDEIMRIISIPSVMVNTAWQKPTGGPPR